MSLKRNKPVLAVREIVLFGIYGGIMFLSRVILQFLPNIHLLGAIIISLTVVYRTKALYPIYVYVLLEGIFGGFNLWWIPYLYIWTVLWGVSMLIPERLPQKIRYPILIGCACLHGLLFGILYAPLQAIMFHLSFKATVAWVMAGFPYDVIHGLGNLALGFLIYPMTKIMIKARNGTG